MRVFVTGAAGFIGIAVVEDLVKNGHQVLGLARSDASADKISKAGGEAHQGDLEDIESLKSGAKTSDGVIHLAFTRDFGNLAHVCQVDRDAIAAMAEVMAGTGKPLVTVTGTLTYPKGKLATEETPFERDTPLSIRAQAADLVYKLSKENNIRGTVVCLAPFVHGVDDGGFIPILADLARKNDRVIFAGDGTARFPGVHKLDAAVLLRLVLEKGRSGATYNCVDEVGVPNKDIMMMMGQCMALPVQSKPMNEAMEAMGFLAQLLSGDNPTSSEMTRKELGWRPSQLGLLADMEKNYTWF